MGRNLIGQPSKWGGRKDLPLRNGKAQPTPLPPEGAKPNGKTNLGSWLRALAPWGPKGVRGGRWGLAALRLDAATLGHLCGPQRGGPSAACCRPRGPRPFPHPFLPHSRSHTIAESSSHSVHFFHCAATMFPVRSHHRWPLFAQMFC